MLPSLFKKIDKLSNNLKETKTKIMDVEWIKNSLLYKSFDTEDEEDDVNLENYQYVCNNTINNRNDMVSMLQTIQYWGVYELPPSIIQYFMIHDIRREEEQFDVVIEDCIINPFVWLYRVYNMDMVIQPEIIRHLNFVDSDVELDLFPYEHFVRLDFYKELSKKRCIHKILAKIACKCNNVECLEFIHNLGHLKLVKDYINIAARYGSISCLIFLHENEYPWIEDTWNNHEIPNTWEYAVMSGNVDCLQYLHDNGCKLEIDPQSPNLLYLAILYRNVNGLKCLFKNGYNLYYRDALIYYASQQGDINSLIFLVETYKDYYHDYSNYSTAMLTGHVDCLQYLHKRGGDWPEWLPHFIAVNGYIGSFIYAHVNGCPMNILEMMDMFVLHGHLECLIYIHYTFGHGLWNESTCEIAAHNGQLECLIYLHDNGCPWDHRTCESALIYGHLDCLKYAHENGCTWQWDDQTWKNITIHGHFDCLKYAHENGCPWNEQICELAVICGRLDYLKYAHENGCPWNGQICEWAATYGRLDYLKYAHENGCPWDEQTCKWAAIHGRLDCLKYAHENGCSMIAVFALDIYIINSICRPYVQHHKPLYWHIYNIGVKFLF